jgi:CBS domain-containing membrane protein
MRAIAHGRDLASACSVEIRVADIMSFPVFTLSATQSLALAESLMSLARIRHIPVLEDGKVVGLVTHRDLLAASISALAPLTADERSSLQLSVPVSRIMRKEVWTIDPRALATNAARLMRDHGIGCLPVVDDGRLAGIVTEADLLRLVTDSLDLARPPRRWTAADAMTPSPITLSVDASLADARAAMDRHRIRHLPLLDGARPVAVVSDRDLRVAEVVYSEPAKARAVRAIQLLGTERAHAVRPSAPLDEVLLEMAERRLDAVVVLEDARLVGIVCALDGCRLLGQHLRADHGVRGK